MSTVYNRRRGASARRMRGLRGCRFVAPPRATGIGDAMYESQPCVRVAEGTSRYCAEHRLRTESKEGPIGRRLRLAIQARNVAYQRRRAQRDRLLSMSAWDWLFRARG